MRFKRELSILLIAGGALATALGAGRHKRLPPVAVVSNPTLHQVDITSHGATLGVSDTGGGYAKEPLKNSEL